MWRKGQKNMPNINFGLKQTKRRLYFYVSQRVEKIKRLTSKFILYLIKLH